MLSEAREAGSPAYPPLRASPLSRRDHARASIRRVGQRSGASGNRAIGRDGCSDQVIGTPPPFQEDPRHSGWVAGLPAGWDLDRIRALEPLSDLLDPTGHDVFYGDGKDLEEMEPECIVTSPGYASSGSGETTVGTWETLTSKTAPSCAGAHTGPTLKRRFAASDRNAEPTLGASRSRCRSGARATQMDLRQVCTKIDRFDNRAVASGHDGEVTSKGNEVGSAPPRGRPVVPLEEAEASLCDIAGKPVHLPARALVTSGPTPCPACGSKRVQWGCDPARTRTQSEIHPLVWDPTQWMADSFVCLDCDAGWIEPDHPRPITWVRPYWVC